MFNALHFNERNCITMFQVSKSKIEHKENKRFFDVYHLNFIKLSELLPHDLDLLMSFYFSHRLHLSCYSVANISRLALPAFLGHNIVKKLFLMVRRQSSEPSKAKQILHLSNTL